MGAAGRWERDVEQTEKIVGQVRRRNRRADAGGVRDGGGAVGRKGITCGGGTASGGGRVGRKRIVVYCGMGPTVGSASARGSCTRAEGTPQGGGIAAAWIVRGGWGGWGRATLMGREGIREAMIV